MFICRKRVIYIWKGMRVSKRWENFPFGIEYPLKASYLDTVWMMKTSLLRTDSSIWTRVSVGKEMLLSLFLWSTVNIYLYETDWLFKSLHKDVTVHGMLGEFHHSVCVWECKRISTSMIQNKDCQFNKSTVAQIAKNEQLLQQRSQPSLVNILKDTQIFNGK